MPYASISPELGELLLHKFAENEAGGGVANRDERTVRQNSESGLVKEESVRVSHEEEADRAGRFHQSNSFEQSETS